MNMPRDFADRLIAMGHDPESYGDMLQSEGVEFVRRYIEELEDTDCLYRQWGPKLRNFATQCRTKHPCLDASTLTDRDIAKLAIYESLINKAERLPDRFDHKALGPSGNFMGAPKK